MLAGLYGFGGDNGCGLRIHGQHGVYELTRPQAILAIVENGFQANRSRVGVHRIVDDRESAADGLGSFFIRCNLDCESVTRLQSRNFAEIAFRHAEGHENRFDLIDHDQRIIVVGLYEISRMHEQISGPSGNRRTNFAIAQVQLRLFDGRLIAFERGTNAFDGSLIAFYGLLCHFGSSSDLVFLHARRDALFRQLLETSCLGLRILQLGAATGEIGFRDAYLGLVFHEGSFRLTQRFSKWTRIDFEQEIAFINVRTLRKPHAQQRPADLCLHLDAGVRFDVTDSTDIFNRHRSAELRIPRSPVPREHHSGTAASAALRSGATTGDQHGEQEDNECGDFHMHHEILADLLVLTAPRPSHINDWWSYQQIDYKGAAMYRTVASLLVLLMFHQPTGLLSQDRVVSPAELRHAIELSAEKRHNDAKSVRDFFSTDKVKTTLNAAHLDAQKIEKAVSVMDDEELSQLAGRVQVAQKEMVGGALSNEHLTYIVIALAAAVLVLVLK